MNKKTLVLGASTNLGRYSNIAVRKLQANATEVVAFGLRQGSIAGINIDTELKLYRDIHTVTLYLSPKHQVQYYDYIIDLNPDRVIFNPGTENPDFFKLLDDHGIAYEMSCTLVLLSTDQY